MTAASASVIENEILIGRARELDQFRQILSERQPDIIALIGEPGSGKTSLLNIVRQEAAAAGWNTAPQNSGGSLTVKPDTSEESFSTQLQTLIISPSETSFIEKSLPKGASESSGESQVLLPIVEQMHSRAPFLLLIDGFQAEDNFAKWFQNHFLQHVRATRSPVIVIVAERSGMSGLEGFANHIIKLDQIDIASIQRHFATLAQKLTPPIVEPELESYVITAHERPDLLSSLTRVLSLAIKTEEA